MLILHKNKPGSRTMSNASPDYKPKGWHTLTPRLFASNAADLVQFLKQTFAAVGELREGAPTQLQLGDSMVMVSDDSLREANPAFLYVYVADTDATYARAITAGAESIETPADLPYGDRRCMVRDAWGNTWQIATHLETLTPEEIANRMQAATD